MNVEVLVVGAGPTGLMLANELRLAGVSVAVLERSAERSIQSKALNLQPRTAEVLDLRGLLEPLLPKAFGRIDDGHFAGMATLHYDGWQTRRPYQVGIRQARTEEYLESLVSDTVLRSRELTGLDQHADHVVAHVGDHDDVTARYLVACDGGRSTVRKLVGTPFDGRGPRMCAVVADLMLEAKEGAQIATDPRAWRSMRNLVGDRGMRSGMLMPLGEGVHRGIFATERQLRAERDEPVTFEEVAEALAEAHGSDVELREMVCGTRFTDANRQVRQYREGRVLYAGDAAHIHTPAGGQGLNLGMQDAFNLGWKLAAVLRGDAKESLLDTYHEERHPVGARVLHNTRAQGLLMGLADDLDGPALQETFAMLTRFPEANRYLAGMISGLDIRYGDGDGPVGIRIPDHDLADGGTLYDRFHGGDWVTVTRDEVPELAADAMLVRPDGYVRWAGSVNGLAEATATRFGAVVATA